MTDRIQVTETYTVLVITEPLELKDHIKRLQKLVAQGYTSIEITDGGWEAQVTKTRLENDEEYLARYAAEEHQKAIRHRHYLELHKEFGITNYTKSPLTKKTSLEIGAGLTYIY